jgi:hypothetical protein
LPSALWNKTWSSIVRISMNERRKTMKFTTIILILLAGAACAPLQTAPQVIDSSTTLPPCSCPGGAIPNGQSQIGVNSGTPVICNCPAILLPPTISATDIGPTLPDSHATGITLDDNGRTFILHPGETFLLNLGTDIFDWTVDIDNQNVLARVKNILVIRGAQGIYEANNPGQAVLTAVGNPFCRNSVPACAAPSMLFKISVLVQ